ncbi:hypothetical protein CRYUN_Cryun08bG0051700 [Craigia yunnanensis]
MKLFLHTKDEGNKFPRKESIRISFPQSPKLPSFSVFTPKEKFFFSLLQKKLSFLKNANNDWVVKEEEEEQGTKGFKAIWVFT